jgi:hypothetical protein
VVAREFREHWWVGLLSYGIASCTALSRIHDNNHWATDVLVGSALGSYVGISVVDMHTDEKAEKPGTCMISPVVNGASQGMQIVWIF